MTKCYFLPQVNETESTLCETDKDAREYRHMIEALQAKCLSLQEEISSTLTALQSAREAGEALSVRLEASRQAEKETEARLAALEEKSSEERTANEQKVMKMQATLAQQAKLIDFLQAKAEQAKKKRVRTITRILSP